MLMLICVCGHSAPLPDVSGRFVCSQCQRAHVLEWFNGPNAIEKYRDSLNGAVPREYRIDWVPNDAGGRLAAEGRNL